MNPKKKNRKLDKNRFPDCHGICLDEVPMFLPPRVADWPRAVRVDDIRVLEVMHGLFHACWNCGTARLLMPYGYRLQAHHIAGGYTKGRSDEMCNIAMLCSQEGCHPSVGGENAILPIQRVLYLKWKFDRIHTDWRRLSLLLNRRIDHLDLKSGGLASSVTASAAS
jgi:hypothetical protein